MNNLILFVNSFLSYVLLMLVIFVGAAIAVFIGIKWRKAKDAKAAAAQDGAQVSETQKDTAQEA